MARARSPALRHVTDPRGKGCAWSGAVSRQLSERCLPPLFWRLPVSRSTRSSRPPLVALLLALLLALTACGSSSADDASDEASGSERRPVAGHGHR